MPLTSSQQKALDAVESGSNVFITGAGGTGKSYLLEQIKRYFLDGEQQYIMCAPTGIAAVKIDGSTIHRALKISTSDPIEYHDAPKLHSKSPLWKCDVLVIDEISMCRIDLFDYVVGCVGMVNAERESQGKGPMQVILVGDFYQLPPVVMPQDVPVLESIYGGDYHNGYCIGSKAWDSLELKTVELTEVVRQEDPQFVDALNRCRMGDTTGLSWITEHAAREPQEGAVYLSGTNREVDRINSDMLEMLDTDDCKYMAIVEGSVPSSSKLAPNDLYLKEGARVMLVANLNDKHINGSLGYVTGFGHDYVMVEFDGEDVPTKIQRYEWTLKAPKVVGKKITFEPIASYKQIPLKLAWAITIHKSQGQTFDAVEINPNCWEPGQLYTALSRASRVEGIHFAHMPNPSHLMAPTLPVAPVQETPVFSAEGDVEFWRELLKYTSDSFSSALYGDGFDEAAALQYIAAMVVSRHQAITGGA